MWLLINCTLSRARFGGVARILIRPAYCPRNEFLLKDVWIALGIGSTSLLLVSLIV
jgi:hypothetical protein